MNDVIGSTSNAELKVDPTFDTQQMGAAWKNLKVFGDTTNQYTSVHTMSLSQDEKIY